MNLFQKKPDNYTEEEYNQMRKNLQDLNLSKKEERAIIFSALKTLLPGVILVLLLVWGILYVLVRFL